jgi:nicotinic acid mononucleotide adenylyltransferase
MQVSSPELSYSSKKARNQIVVWFGGSFSPPTFAHRAVALAIYNKLYNSFPDKSIKIVFVPSNRYYTKSSVGKSCIKDSERLQLVQLMITELNGLGLPSVKFNISDFEIQNGQKTKKATPTFLSVRSLEKQFKVKPSNIYITLRQFNFESLLKEQWIQPITLLERYNFIILPTDESIIYQSEAENRLLDTFMREAAELGVDDSPDGIALRSRIVLVDAESRRISGSTARRAAHNGTTNLSTITVEPVANYIRSHKLYKSKACLGTRSRVKSNLSATRKRTVNANN